MDSKAAKKRAKVAAKMAKKGVNPQTDEKAVSFKGRPGSDGER